MSFLPSVDISQSKQFFSMLKGGIRISLHANPDLPNAVMTAEMSN